MAESGLTFKTHLGVWKVRVPEQPFKILSFLFLAFAVIGALIWGMIPEDSLPKYFLPTTSIAVVHAELLFLCFAVSYVFFYQGLKTKSPSINMVMMVEKAGDKGIDGSAFMDIITEDNLIKPRIRFLSQTNMAYVNSGKYRLTYKGKVYARPIVWYRRFLRLNKYGG